eukprot:g23529.t1
MDSSAAAEVVAVMDYDDGAAFVLEQLEAEQSGKILAHLEPSVAAAIVTARGNTARARAERVTEDPVVLLMDFDIASNLLAEMDPSAAAGVVSLMEADAAAGVLTAASSYHTSAQVVDKLTEECAAEVFSEMEPEASAGIASELEYETSARAVALMEPSTAAALLEAVEHYEERHDSAGILGQMSYREAAKVVEEMDAPAAVMEYLEYEDAGGILMEYHQAAKIFTQLSSASSASIIYEMDPDSAAYILAEMDHHLAAEILLQLDEYGGIEHHCHDPQPCLSLRSELEYDHAAEILSRLKVPKAAAILSEAEYYDAAGILEKMDLAKAQQLLRSGFLDRDAILDAMEDAQKSSQLRTRVAKRRRTLYFFDVDSGGRHPALRRSSSGQVFNAVLTAMAVLDVAKLPKFQAQLAPDCKTPTQVLAYVLEHFPKVLPSFVRMPEDWKGRQLGGEAQSLARDCVTNEFIFAEFIWAEIPPASVTAVKNMLSESRDSRKTLTNKKYLEIFLYCVFVEMSASRSQSLEGSLYMTEDSRLGQGRNPQRVEGRGKETPMPRYLESPLEQWKEFEVGKNAILQLEKESEQVVYDSILQRSAKLAGFSFNPSSSESRALARLACMANITESGGGIHPAQKPAFAFESARYFLMKAIHNLEVGPLAALQILLKVCEEVQKKWSHDTSRSVLMVKLGRLATFAEEFKGRQPRSSEWKALTG